MAHLWYVFLVYTALVLLSCHHASTLVSPTPTFTDKNTTDRQALISFKSTIYKDPRGTLASWNDSIHFCQWLGVICGGRRHPQRVTSLTLRSIDLIGVISTAIANLTFLRKLDLSDNQIHGSIPEDVGRLFRLQHLNLSMNAIEGGIPTSLCNLFSLTKLYLFNNNLSESLPPTIGNLTSLTVLFLHNNKLSGSIPPSLANISPLSVLALANNNLSGSIPPTMGNLASLTELYLYDNSLSGRIPPSLSSLSSLSVLEISGNKLSGGIPPAMGNLSSLTILQMHDNELSGSIPNSLAKLLHLSVLSLSGNTLSDRIPLTMGNLTSLTELWLSNNSLTGNIPPSLGNLSSLSILYLSNNKLSGGIPPSLGNLISLTQIAVDHNQLSATIPPSLGKLSNLKQLYLSANNLSEAIPPSLWNLSSLSILSMSFNYHLSGSLPMNLGQALPLLEIISLSCNQFHGHIPMSLSNASSLEYVEFPENRFTGTVPPNLGNLQNLRWLNLQANHLQVREPHGWSFLTSLTNCSNLEKLDLGWNNLSGMLPNSIANLSATLRKLSIGYNNISGTISPDIQNLVNLLNLHMGPNLLTGSIPASIGGLYKLHELILDNNDLSGEIPSAIGNLTQLNLLYLDFNQLSGNIPASLGNCQNLDFLSLESNKLSGGIPKEILSISHLSIFLSLASNSLTAFIPSEIGSLKNLGIIDFSMNKLSGEIPSTLSECQVLEELYLGGNFLQGSIPTSFGSLSGIRKIDVSKNNLSGKIPDFLQEFRSLSYLNLSFNNFEGEVPRYGVFENVSRVSVIGNNRLCGGNPEMHLSACSSQSPNMKHNSHAWVLIVGIACSFIFFFLLFCFLIRRCWTKCSRRKPHNSALIKEQYERVSYAELVKATNGFSSDKVIGTGCFGTVYKGILDEESWKVVAVTVINLQIQGASKSFMAECEALRNIRHRNLVKILTACSSVDFRGNDFKAVIFEFMDNGSLDDWLHPKTSKQFKKLNLMQRLDIAIDVASALDYLHHQADIPIIHCDLKPSNILLDIDMTAHVGDFGLARFLQNNVSNSSQCSSSSVGLKGTVGYIAPEYGMANKVSTHGDVYSFGILLLEMLTAKRPTDDIFIGGLSLRKFVVMSLPERIKNVVDTHLLKEEDGDAGGDDARNMTIAGAVECIASMLRIGISASNELPGERTEMGDIIRALQKVRDVFMKIGSRETENVPSSIQ